MQTEKKTFTKAEIEIIHFDRSDIITTSVDDKPHGPTVCCQDPVEIEYGEL